MWRRICTSQLKALALTHAHSSCRSAPSIALSANRSLASPPLFVTRLFSTESAGTSVKKVEDVMPIATGHEREELEAELEGRKLLDINYPVGPFGTKEAPAVIKSYYDKRIVGCPGGEGGGIFFSLLFPLSWKMNMMLSGFGWRKASHMNVQCAHSTLCWKWWAQEDLQMDMAMMIIITDHSS
ncbi:hypothetical protein JRO89_XS09G0131700 [Xanthoceras sorbifolium]|uniref:Uncharacterized protein n=1 Tax=Xanthoceras sorbifolium TaxID=99658 RepID=A0ABQ8HL59_9ROSI|nr:hypothetical protein JRO89_XS09G0131700 [Xanthoceras sorbifolium]